MKFGLQIKALRILAWKDHYINYGALKRILKSLYSKSVEDFAEKDKEDKTLLSPLSPGSLSLESEKSPLKDERTLKSEKIRSSKKDERSKEVKISRESTSESTDTTLKSRKEEKRRGSFQLLTSDRFRRKEWIKRPRTITEVHKDFFDMYEYELNKVQLFYLYLLRHYEQLLRNCQLQFYTRFSTDAARRKPRTEAEKSQDLKEVATNSKQIAHDLTLLKSFVEVNRTAARKILKKHDKITKVDTKDVVLEKVAGSRSFFLAEELRALKGEAERFQSEVSKYVVRRQIAAS